MGGDLVCDGEIDGLDGGGSRVNYREYLINWGGISLISRGGNSLREHALMNLLSWLKA